MARIRSLKPEAFQSELLALVSLAAERTFWGLTTQADDRGRFPDKPVTINGLLWAERSERTPHPPAELDAELAELASAGLLCRYTGCDGRRYLHDLTWDREQRIDKPSQTRLPRCPLHGHQEACGLHAGSCPPREPSRALDSHENGTNCEACGKPPRESSREVASPREDSARVPDQGQQISSRALASVREPSPADLGPRTLKPPPTPPGVQSPILGVVPSENTQGDLQPERTPETAAALAAEILALRPAWSTSSIAAALDLEAVTERTWAATCIAYPIVARDPETQRPGRLAQNGPWWDIAFAVLDAPPELTWCGKCNPYRHLEDPLTHGDLGRCPDCHPSILHETSRARPA